MMRYILSDMNGWAAAENTTLLAVSPVSLSLWRPLMDLGMTTYFS